MTRAARRRRPRYPLPVLAFRLLKLLLFAGFVYWILERRRRARFAVPRPMAPALPAAGSALEVQVLAAARDALRAERGAELVRLAYRLRYESREEARVDVEIELRQGKALRSLVEARRVPASLLPEDQRDELLEQRGGLGPFVLHPRSGA
jgi:hypothetical protein